MSAALAAAERGLFTTSPNPHVGCVIVRDGAIVAEGWHERWGGPHAEVNALRAAGDRAVGGTAYVTLEPCNHTGKTPPCVDALITAKVKRVVAAMADPNPIASGGAERLRAAGIRVEF
ncbi:MAG: bifunctional diaminohydroxyphosphoribosylaminopyrimidine deaminase/5-amino-6-(5-phosphoribosylamino)uracil reductase RibD, partial [Burkholderiales bacterium]